MKLKFYSSNFQKKEFKLIKAIFIKILFDLCLDKDRHYSYVNNNLAQNLCIK
jgi:hypothetical protein